MSGEATKEAIEMALISDIRGLGKVAVSRGVLMIALIAGLFLFSAPAWAQISLVHVTSCGAQTFPAMCTIPATAPGNLIVVGFATVTGYHPTITTITDSAGNSYGEAGNALAVNTASNYMADIWYAKNILSGATSVTITPSASGTAAAVIWEFSNADTVSPLDQTAVVNNQMATTTPLGAAVSTTAPGDVIISVLNPDWSVTGINAGNAFTNDSRVFGAGWAHLMAGNAGTYAAQWVAGSSGAYVGSTVSLKAAGSTVQGVTALNACDLNADGLVNVLDVNRSVNMTLGMSPCTANVTGPGVCTVVTVQRVVNASLPGGACVMSAASVIPTGLSCTPSSVNALGTSACTGTLSGAAPSGGLNLTLSSNNANVTVPGSVSVAAGVTTFGFTATVGSITTGQTAVLTASANGASPTFSLSLTPLGVSHSVTLTWIASTSSNVAGYNVYRGTTSGGPYATNVNSSLVTGLSYTDTTVLAGQTYYYVLTAVDTSGNESGYSTQTAATIPTP
jgi:hypothetical protein